MIFLNSFDALLITDIQNDFLAGGTLSIRGSDDIIPTLENYILQFHARRLPIFLTRDWHPPKHCSFQSQGGPWPAHCLAGLPGSLPPSSFVVPPSAVIIYKAIDREHEAYSAFEGTALERHLRALSVQRLFVGGLATEYCVLHSVKDARRLGYEVCLLVDGIKAVNLQPDDGDRAEDEMLALGAVLVRWERREI